MVATCDAAVQEQEQQEQVVKLPVDEELLELQGYAGLVVQHSVRRVLAFHERQRKGREAAHA